MSDVVEDISRGGLACETGTATHLEKCGVL